MTRTLAALALVLAACGSSQPAIAPNGATLEGNVLGATALTVDVPGTSLATRTDASGHFALLAVPEGSKAVHFSGTGVDASLEIEPLAKREHRSISVSVSGHDATEHHEAAESSLRGAIESIAAPAFVLNGKTVTTSASTQFKKAGAAITFADLKVGDQVEAEGALQQDGSLLARSVSVEDPQAAPGADAGTAEAEDVKFEGALAAMSGTSLTVGTTAVTTNASTRIEKNDQIVAPSALAVGDQLAVEGLLQADGSVLATEIHVMSAAEAAETHVTGAVASVASDSFMVGTSLVKVDAHTEYSGHSLDSLASLAVGDLVDVDAAQQADGSFLALKVDRIERAGGH